MTGTGGDPDTSIPQVPRIGFYNAKGGTGKTTIAVEASKKMARSGLKVGLVDMDFSTPKSHYTIGMRKSFRDVADAMDFKNLYPFEFDGIPGLYVFSMGFLVRDGLSILLSEDKILEAVHTIFTVVKWPDNLDVFCLDMPPQTSKLNIEITTKILRDKDRDGICIVTTPRYESLMDTLRTLDMLRFYQVKTFGYVLNMAYHECSKCSEKEWNGEDIKTVRKMLKAPLICTVPFTNDIDKYLDVKNMLKSIGITPPRGIENETCDGTTC